MRTWIVGTVPLIFSASLFAMAHDRLPTTVFEEPAVMPALEASPVACGGFPYKVMLVVLKDGIPLNNVDLVGAIDDRVGQMDDDDAIIDIIQAPSMQPDGKTVRVDLRMFPDSQTKVGSLLTRQAVLWMFDAADLEALEVIPSPGMELPAGLPLTPIVANVDLKGALATRVAGKPVLRLVLDDAGTSKVVTAIAEAGEERLQIAVALDRTIIESAFSETPVPSSGTSSIDLQGLSTDRIDEFAIELRAGPLPQPLQASFSPREPEPWCLE